MTFASFFHYPDGSEAADGDEVVLLPDLGEREWATLLSYTQRRRYVAGDLVIRAGDQERALYVVAAGTLELADGGGRRRRVTATYDPGAVIGEVAFFDGSPRSAGVRAVTECELVRLSLESFEVMAAREPVLARRLLFDLGRILAARLRRMNTLTG